MKRIFAVALAALLILSMVAALTVSASAADYKLTDASVTLDGTGAKTVDINLTSTTGGRFYTLQADWSTGDLADSGYITLTGLTAGSSAINPLENSATTGHIYWAESNLNSFQIAASGTIWTATYTVSSDTPAGTYAVSLDIAAVWGGVGAVGSEPEDENLPTMTALITVEREDGEPDAPAEDTTAPAEDTTAAPAEDTTASPAEDTTIAPAEDTTAADGDADIIDDDTDETTETTAPAEGSTSSTEEDAKILNTNINAPKTGSTGVVVLWAVLLAVAAVIIEAIYLKRRPKAKHMR